jgi:luciferase family oxidoreductase group 1
VQLSVLDQSPISAGFSAGSALKNTLRLAKETEDMGYTRFWVAEHHNTNGLASSSPEVLIPVIASHTKRIKVGSGGVLLPQYSPFKVAENFRMLETIFPGRIDLGIGRSPGGSTETRLALTDGIRKSLNEFPHQLKRLQEYLHDQQEVKAYPKSDTNPELWILGTSHRGARVAAEQGTAFTYGHFINPVGGKRAAEEYRRNFQPSLSLKVPKMNVCVFVVCAETEEEAHRLARSQDLWLIQVEKGMDTRIPSASSLDMSSLSNQDKVKIENNRKRMVIGNPIQVKIQLAELSDYYETEEIMVITNLYDIEARIRSYQLLAEEFGLI